MEMQTKNDFKYAKLFQEGTGEICTDGSLENLQMGPETARRFEENTDDCAVTICCITYKHEDYIASALDSFLMQKTNFKFKIFVGEDKGPDRTADIVREYAEKYPDVIVPFIREENMGAQANLIDLCKHANSPYIAFCEGDDYWTDEYKLQKQYDYMQNNINLRACFARAEIDAPKDWFLRSWFRESKEGKLIYPDCERTYKIKKEPIGCADCIWFLPAHTSTMFFRWNYDIEVPEWYYTGIIGDQPIFLMQIGEGKAGFIPDKVSVYRRSDVGVYMSDSMDEHFLKTRLDFMRWGLGMLDWYKDHQTNYPKVLIENRIKHEVFNYLRVALKLDDEEAMMALVNQYPEAAKISLNAYLSFYNDSRALTKTCGWDGYQLIVRHKVYRQGLKVYAAFLKVFDKFKVKCIKVFKNIGLIFKAIGRGLNYWKYTSTTKIKNLWVVTSFRNRGYLDNSKYFYEYVAENFPEIDVRWLTNDEGIYNQLKSEGKPVCMEGTPESVWLLSHAEVAVTDHFAMSDYKGLKGFNDKTKIVQLWHGVGFKSMGDANGIRNTTERGVQYSNDILVNENDGFFTRVKKKIKYFFFAPFRELFEKYFLFVCPGQERLDMIADVWHISHENCFMAGHPRDLPVYSAERQTNPIKIMYAPTYRFNYNREKAMVQEFLDSAPQIQKLMEEVNGEFCLRMHPHTWRNYSNNISKVLKKYDRIYRDEEKDVYNSIGTYSVVISDYSSIALDFALLDRPVIFHGQDYDWFVENEAGFNLDFPNVIPGPMTANWEETLQKVKEYVENPEKDADLREEKIKYFFTKEVNGPDNSERIVEEIKRRLGI